MGMTGFNMWREAEAKKKSINANVEKVTESPKADEVKVEETATPTAPKKGKKPVEKVNRSRLWAKKMKTQK